MPTVLSPTIYFRRNLGKTLPMAFVVMLAITLVASVVTIVHSIDLTVYTLYGYNRYLTGLTPRNTLTIDDAQVSRIKKLPELGFLFPSHSYSTRVKTIFGKMVFPLFGLDAPGREMLLQRCGLHIVQGRMVVDGAPEAVMSDDVARNLGLKLGDVVCEPKSEDAYAPVPVRLVGLLRGPVWLGLTSRALADTYSPLSWSGYLAFAPTRDPEAERRLDDAIEHVVEPGQVRIWRYSGLLKETQSSLSNLYLILNIVIAIIVFAISFVCGLLSNIYFTQRLPEIATLAAIGYPRGQLLRRALGETFLLCLFGWAMGSVVTCAGLVALREIALKPRGLLLNPIDPGAYAFTLPLPIAITVFALVTLGVRLSRLDPVSIIERRG